MKQHWGGERRQGLCSMGVELYAIVGERIEISIPAQ